MSLESLRAEADRVGAEAFTARGYRPGTVVHVVLFRYLPGVSDAQKAEVTRRFHELASTERDGEPYIVSITSGWQASGEPPAAFEHGFTVTFASLGDRNFYVGEPIVESPVDEAHAAFKTFIGPLLAENGVLVFDYVV